MKDEFQKPSAGPGLLRGMDTGLQRWISGWNPYAPENLRARDIAPVEVGEAEIRKTLARLFMLFFVLFLGWAVLAPIDAGIAVSGTVVVFGNRKSVQHNTGGVVEEILVKEGMPVQQGDVLLRINPLNSQANLTTLELQYINLLATESRLKSERAGLAQIRWVPELSRTELASDGRVVEARNLQVQFFNSRRAEYQSQVSGLNEQLAGFSSVLRARREQAKSLAEEMVNSQSLARDGYVPQNAANAAERQKVELDGNIATVQADIGRARLQIAQLQSGFMKEVDSQLQEAQKNRDAIEAKLEAAKFERKQFEVRSPSSGSVVGLKVFTVGGFVASGQVLMEIVPKDEVLIIEAKVPTTTIDKVVVGQMADVRFINSNLATTPVVPGLVKVVGADRQPPSAANEGEYYLAQVHTTPEGLRMLGELKVQPGMAADVIIKSGERTFMRWLLKPLTDSLSRAFK